jgi:hypothetical protein
MMHVPLIAKIGGVIIGSTVLAAITEPASVYIPIWAAVGVTSSAVVAPLINAWARRVDRRASWKREDDVAKRAAETAELLVKSNKEVATAAAATHGQIAEIHHMVDGQMTLAMSAELDSKVISLTLMQEVVELKRQDRDIAPTAQTVATMDKLQQQIDDLALKIKERKTLASKSVTPTKGT